VINGGDMLPKAGSLFDQGRFITGYLAKHFEQSAERRGNTISASMSSSE
jgi:hypothetical protein